MKNKLPFFVSWLVGSFLLYFATLTYPDNFVLGSARHSVLSAAVFSGLVWTLIIFSANPILKSLKLKLGKGCAKFVFGYFVSFAGLWIVARLAPYTGFGVTRFTWLMGLSLLGFLFLSLLVKIFSFNPSKK
ncbi:MAG: hypothetical protein Q8P91_01355 [bacterium]|nr:hypothetical protein [bacterium]